MMHSDDRRKGIIVKGIAGFYYVKSGDAVYRCKARGIFKQRDIKPAVGDEVMFEIIPDNDDSLTTDILPRKKQFHKTVHSKCGLLCDRDSRPESCAGFPGHR